jgi:hypothetical protein
MRIWYVVDWYEYWLEPDYTIDIGKRLRLHGARMYSPENKYLGYWPGENIPIVVRNQLRAIIQQQLLKDARRDTTHKIDMSGRKA